jgi:hypothetical protein
MSSTQTKPNKTTKQQKRILKKNQQQIVHLD